MRKHVWQRVGPSRRFYLEVLPGLLLSFCSIGVVSAAALQHQTSPSAPASGAAEAALTPEEQARLQAAAAAKDKAKTDALHKTVNSNVAGGAETDPSLADAVISSVPNAVNNTLARQMWFIATPTSMVAAKELAQDAAAKLNQFAKSGIQSLAVMEPTTTSGGIVNFGTYQSGGYDQFLNSFYDELKLRGITDATMGMWVIMPEANMPEWGQSDPAVISACITKTATAQKKRFPGSLASVMLNSQTYPGNDTSYSQGQYKSLAPYLQSIPKGLIDSFGYQGFPWAAPANQSGPSDLAPSNFLRPNLASEAANALGVKSIWLNTGTIRRAYTNDSGAAVTFAGDKRAQLLDGILQQAKTLKNQGYGVAVNIFAGDKSGSSEAIDWSYPDADASVYANFTGQLKANGMGSWQYLGN